MKMWAGRFRQPLDPGFERWQRSFEFDRRLLAYEIAASRAHARALKNAGIVSSDELISILQGLDQITEQAAMSPAFLDDDEAEHVADCRARVNICPLGSGAVAGTTIHLDRRAIAEELGFDAVTSNSVDATSDRDFVLEFVNALTLLSLHLSRWAEEMIIFSSQEFGFVHLPEAYSTGSSAMPQKKNPDLLELVRGKAARVAGDATTLLVAVKGLPLAYNKDLQETQQPLFDASETVLSVLPLISGFMKVVEFDYDRMQKTAESGLTT